MSILIKRQVIVRNLPTQSSKWHRLPEHSDYTMPKTIRASYSRETGSYDTGLNDEERAELEAKTGFDLSPIFNSTEPHPFWDSKAGEVKLEYGTNIFDMSNPFDYIKVAILKSKNTELVANSHAVLSEYPEAIFVIHDEEEKAKVNLRLVEKKKEAYGILSKLTNPDKKRLLTLCENNGISDNQSSSWVENRLAEIIEEDIDLFLRFSKMTKKDQAVHALIIEGIYKNILTKEGSSIYYQSDHLGYDLATTIEYFKNPDNQNLKLKLMEKIKE